MIFWILSFKQRYLCTLINNFPPTGQKCLPFLAWIFWWGLINCQTKVVLGPWIIFRLHSTTKQIKKDDATCFKAWKCFSIIEIYIFSGFTYGSETWTLTEEAKRRINAFEIWCYRRMLKISWRRFMSNDKVLKLLREDRYFMKKIAERKFEYAGHVLRGSSGRLMTRVLEGMIEGTIEGKQGVGRQRKMWLHDIKRWSGERRY